MTTYLSATKFLSLGCAALALSAVLTGCHVNTHHNGNNDNVDIGTPFGSMHVKTDGDVDAVGLGITPYPGAQLEKKNDKDKGAADINMSFGNFHLGVKAVSYITPDSQEKVLTFYRNDLKKYGDVLQCRGSQTIGEPARTSEGLTCSDGGHKSNHISINTSDDKDQTELRAGSKQRQHIVAVEPKDGGTRIGLVALDLPHNVSGDHEKESD